MKIEGLGNNQEKITRYSSPEDQYVLEDPAMAIERDIDLLLQEPTIKENIPFVKTLESIKRHAKELKKEKPPTVH